MKTLGLSLFLATAFLSSSITFQTPNCAGEEHGSAMQIQGRPLTAWVAEVDAHESTGERNPALKVLVSIGPRIMTNLANLLLHDPSTAEQAGAAVAMGAIAFQNPGAPELSVAVPGLAFAAESQEPRLRVLAIQGLGTLGRAASNTIPLLVRSTKDADSSVRMCAVEALGRIGFATPQTLDALKSCMSDSSGDVSILSVRAIYELGQPASTTIPVLVRLTKDKSVGVRCAAVETLGWVGTNSPEALAAVKSALEDPSKDFVQPIARKTLNKLAANNK
jgi:hypothetical protein